ncbi:hypothetical protein Mp_6g10130 [Marchantia polymorpha subsp. ruderalis]|uniref:Uncharacterized protein n=2 Tax=Marchantia polymorpha TaxID=3197 RepID=A0AAF6BQH2_MARPO|nr:hypothetical protein MARPO_0016s0056 [Marchantia polymorpha]BBN14256.1 hypothetical protein Mp_6g10130 [Marchantia polymorpha subsp. ruderalis]|eukprot:PTQ44991.1 hypothetical protein MARPO_0016s0056 [Marchantia polymorpha]
MGYGVSSFIIKWVNFLTLGVSFCVLGLGIWLSTKHGDCDEFLTAPVIIVGIFVFLISLLGFVGSWKDIAWLLWIVLLFSQHLHAETDSVRNLTSVCSFVITNEGAGRAISGQGFEEYRLADYSGYIRKLFNNHQIWKHLRACLLNPDYCAEIGRTYSSVADLKSGQLNSIQSGCCRPPSECKFPMINATYYDLSSRYVQTNSSSVSIGKSNVTGISAPWGTTPQDEPPPPGATPDEPPPPADEPPPPAGATPDEPPPPAGATPDEPPPPAGSTPPDEPPPPPDSTPPDEPPPAGATPAAPVVKFAAVSGSRQPPRAQLKVRRVKTINVSSTLVQHDAAPSPIKHYDDPDCVIYQNDPDTMCFECDSCKAGVAQFIKKDWRLVAIINIAVLLFLVALYTVGCCARRNASRAQYSKV